MLHSLQGAAQSFSDAAQSLSDVPPKASEAGPSTSFDAGAHLVVDDDVNSSETEVRETSSSDGEMVDGGEKGATTESAMDEVEVVPASPFKVVLPPPLEAATTTALLAIQQWWRDLEPLLKQLQLQAEPFLRASVDGLAHIQLQLKPHTDAAAAAALEWKAKLAPHTDQVVAAVRAATEAVRAQAYEPALVAVTAATEAVTAHAATLAALVSTKTLTAISAGQVPCVPVRPNPFRSSPRPPPPPDNPIAQSPNPPTPVPAPLGYRVWRPPRPTRQCRGSFARVVVDRRPLRARRAPTPCAARPPRECRSGRPHSNPRWRHCRLRRWRMRLLPWRRSRRGASSSSRWQSRSWVWRRRQSAE